jgi:hypothetical protein
MSSEVEADGADSEVRRRSATGAFDAAAPVLAGPSAPLLGDAVPQRPPYVFRVLGALVLLLVLGAIGFELFAATDDDGVAWTPPAGLSAADTPPWLQILCADRTPELCALADRARNPSDCDALRATLRQLEGLERTLTARGTLSSKQRWVLIELYGQGHTLCQFVRGGPTAKTK